MITNDNKPLFLQIKAWIEDHILRDEWQSGSQLPSVRELSAEFGVNPNTIARTYERLTLDGTVRSARGVGFFVAEEAKSAIIKQRKEEFYNEQMPAFIQQMQLLGITPNEIQEQYNKFLSDEDK
ncbi:MAG: GntR family transcriptional regulator [Alistipes sp.]|jgi:DNA-binding transcriptional regulator YhcF (GntR family)|nr:GntR family transcriptional regulator [Alistipes sp.]MBR2331906.1 GntR family transcriptional regulator [Alistipes sp.]MBR2399551.1 GntR family transcriptional regulator [Alistipes sp.]